MSWIFQGLNSDKARVCNKIQHSRVSFICFYVLFHENYGISYIFFDSYTHFNKKIFIKKKFYKVKSFYLNPYCMYSFVSLFKIYFQVQNRYWTTMLVNVRKNLNCNTDHSNISILRILFTFCPCKEFEDIRLVAPAPHISCLHFCLVFWVLLKIVWCIIKINEFASQTRKKTFSFVSENGNKYVLLCYLGHMSCSG